MTHEVHTGTAYMLREVRPDFTSRDGFQWPKEGKVVAPTRRGCGGGCRRGTTH